MADLAALVALSTTLAAEALATLLLLGSGVGVVALAGQMAGLAASVASLLLLRTSALTA